MKNALVSLVAVSVLCAFASTCLAGPAKDRVKEGVDKIIAILDEPAYKGGKKRDEMVKRVADLTEDYFDYQELSMRAVGEPWLKFSEKQRVDFVKAFSDLLKKTYLAKVESYNNEKVEYLDEKVEGNRAMVLTEVVTKDKKMSANYKLIKKDRWMIYDVSGEGVSLVLNYRSQFDAILKKESPDALIKRIQDKVKAIDEGKVDASKDNIFESKKK
jgi:phospholipid transport system substrate-binding protein